MFAVLWISRTLPGIDAADKQAEADPPGVDALNVIIESNPICEFWRCFGAHRRQGQRWNHTPAWRIYRAMGLNQGRRTKKRLSDREAKPQEVPVQMNHTWLFCFMTDALGCGRRLRTLNIINEGT